MPVWHWKREKVNGWNIQRQKIHKEIIQNQNYTEKDTMDKKQNEGMEDFIASAIRRKNEEVQTLRLETHRLKNGAQVPLFHFPLLDQTGEVRHCFTTRYGGVSEGIFSSLNLSFNREM